MRVSPAHRFTASHLKGFPRHGHLLGAQRASEGVAEDVWGGFRLESGKTKPSKSDQVARFVGQRVAAGVLHPWDALPTTRALMTFWNGRGVEIGHTMICRGLQKGFRQGLLIYYDGPFRVAGALVLEGATLEQLRVDPASRKPGVPVDRQFAYLVRREVTQGSLLPHTELGSMSAMARQLGVADSTLQRVTAELQEEGLLRYERKHSSDSSLFVAEPFLWRTQIEKRTFSYVLDWAVLGFDWNTLREILSMGVAEGVCQPDYASHLRPNRQLKPEELALESLAEQLARDTDQLPMEVKFLGHFRRLVASGMFKERAILPPTLHLAKPLGISAPSVQNGYRRLEEARLITKQGAGRGQQVLIAPRSWWIYECAQMVNRWKKALQMYGYTEPVVVEAMQAVLNRRSVDLMEA